MGYTKYNWKKIRLLNKGGQAYIYLFEDRYDPTGRLYIGKQAKKPKFAEGIKREHNILKSLIKSGFQYAADENSSGPGQYTSFRRFCEGVSIFDFLEGKGMDPNYFCLKDNSEELFLSFALKLSGLVSHLHNEKNLVHRDIKPQNVLYGDYNSVALIDLGIARTSNTQGKGEGTKNWAPKEQMIPGQIVKTSHDMYSLGKLLLWVLRVFPSTTVYDNYISGENVPIWIRKNKAAQQVIEFCFNCVQTNEYSRPTITDLVKSIRSAISAGNRKKKIYEICPNCGANTYPGNPLCFSCLTPLIFEPPSGICAGCGREIQLSKLKRHYENNHPEFGDVPKGKYHPVNGVKMVFSCDICNWATTDKQFWNLHEKVCTLNDPLLNISNYNLDDNRPFVRIQHLHENLRSLLAQSQAGLRFETLEVYRSLNIQPYDHQEDTVIRALRDLNGRCIIADGVGLGKTIECGIILRELLYRDLVKSVLILVPNYELQVQWLVELEDKFKLGPNDLNGFKGWNYTDIPPEKKKRIVVNFDTLNKSITLKSQKEKLGGKSNRIIKPLTNLDLFLNDYMKWDVIIIDEAHELGDNWENEIWQKIYNNDPQYLFLVTATPMRQDPADLYPLIKAIDPILAGDFDNFSESYGMKTSTLQDRNKLKALLSQVMIRHTRNDVHSFQFPRRKAITYFVQLNDFQKSLYNSVKGLIRSDKKKISNIAFEFRIFDRFYHSFSEFSEWLQDKDSKASGHKFCVAMEKALKSSPIRHKDSSYWYSIEKITKRICKTRPRYVLDPKMVSLYSILENYWKTGHFKNLGKNGENSGDVEIYKDGIKKSPILIFAGTDQARDHILEVLSKRLKKNNKKIKGFKSEMEGIERQKILEEYNKGMIDVLVCGNAQSRGLNLQFGNILINMELPNSPIEIEQRIGRVERLQQKKSYVIIINIMYDTQEEKIRWDLYSKHLLMFEEILEDYDLISLFTSAEIVNKIEDLNRSIIEGIDSHETIEKKFQDLHKDLEKIKILQDSSLRREDEEDIY